MHLKAQENPGLPCDQLTARQVLKCADQKITRAGQVFDYRLAIGYLSDIYKASRCQKYVCTLAVWYTSRANVSDLKIQHTDAETKSKEKPETRESIENSAIEYGEECLAHPGDEDAVTVASVRTALLRPEARNRAKNYHKAGVTLLVLGGVGVLASSILLGIDGLAVPGRGMDCSVGGVVAPCMFTTGVPAAVGLGVSIGIAATGLGLTLKARELDKVYRNPTRDREHPGDQAH